MLDYDTQKELLKQMVSPTKALEIAIHMEIGAQNQRKINQNLKINDQPLIMVNNFQGSYRITIYQQQRKDFTCCPIVPQNHHAALSSQPQQTNVNQVDTTTTKRDDKESVNYLTSYQQIYVQSYDSNYDSNSDDYVAAISSDIAIQLERFNAKIQHGKIIANSMIDSGSGCSITTKPLAINVLKSTPSQMYRWITTKRDRDLKTFSNEPIKVLGKFATKVVCKDLICADACSTVVEDGHKLIIGTDLFSSFGLAVVQQQAKRGKCVNNDDYSICKVDNRAAISQSGFKIWPMQDTCSYIKFHQKFTTKHQNVVEFQLSCNLVLLLI